MSILTINAGSSSIKYSLFETATLRMIDHGLIEEITDHHQGFERMRVQLLEHKIDLTAIDAIAHRMVHGAERFCEATLINDAIMDELKALIPLAPLHNPANIEGILAARSIAPDVPSFALFDTAFHQSLPPHAYRYPLPHELYETYHIRRYGFHGISHHYVALEASKLLNKSLDELNLISFHIGNGVSACAIENGRSIDTTMGLTPLEGLMMGTRCGNIDPSIIGYLMREKNLTIDEIDTLLNKRSGLLAIAGSSDMRTILAHLEEGEEKAHLALDMFIHRLRKQLGAYMAILPRVDGIVFTGGIGEHSEVIRIKICEHLTHMGIDPHHPETSIPLLTIPANEELQMARTIQPLLSGL